MKEGKKERKKEKKNFLMKEQNEIRMIKKRTVLKERK